MELLDCILCSPPYADSVNSDGHGIDPTKGVLASIRPKSTKRGREKSLPTSYGHAEGQIGALKEGSPMTSQETREVPVETWAGCYCDSWRDFITPASFAHPAKFARGLVQRILSFGFEQGYWRPGDTLGDPFAGIATGGLMAAYAGLRWVGVELEERFCSLARDNIELHRYRLEKLGCPLPVMVQGDSRQFAALAHQRGAILTSPPYAESLNSAQHGIVDERRQRNHSDIQTAYYGHTEGQSGSLPCGSLPAGTLGVDGIVTSPPWENVTNQKKDAERLEALSRNPNGSNRLSASQQTDYGASEGQIGQQQGGTYWEACAQVYQQCWLSLKPGGVLVVVVKGYIRDKQLVDLPSQTATLLQSLGFELLVRVHALLSETTTEKGLFGEELVQKRERKSFFRRLAEKKGSPPIDYEVILFARKVGGEGSGVLTGVLTSPPWQESLDRGRVTKEERIRFAREHGISNAEHVSPIDIEHARQDHYGSSPGQIGNLPPGVPPGDGGEHE